MGFRCSGFGVWGLGFGVWGLGFRFQVSGVEVFGLGVLVLVFKVDENGLDESVFLDEFFFAIWMEVHLTTRH